MIDSSDREAGLIFLKTQDMCVCVEIVFYVYVYVCSTLALLCHEKIVNF